MRIYFLSLLFATNTFASNVLLCLEDYNDTVVCDCAGRVYVGATGNFNGNRGGRSAADSLCDAAFAGSRVCNYPQLVESRSCGATMPSGQGWINTESSTDCVAWNSSSILVSGKSWATDSTTVSTTCNTSQPFLCCK